MEQSNDLRYTATKTIGKEVITVKIRLNDGCKNGHQDFSITGDIYRAGKPRTDKYHISSGCIHEDIAKAFPEFIPFIRLHLADYDGVPVYAIENGFYNLSRIDNYCEEYRVTPDQLGKLRTARNTVQFAHLLVSLGILEQWKQDAQTAIKELERLTGKTFVNDSKKKANLTPPTAEQIAEEERKQAEGYYAPEAEAKRTEQTTQDKFNKLEEERQKGINKINLEYDVKKEVLAKGGYKALDNCIFYNHTKELAFNWRGFDEELKEEFINNLISQLQLPEGVTAKIATKK